MHQLSIHPLFCPHSPESEEEQKKQSPKSIKCLFVVTEIDTCSKRSLICLKLILLWVMVGSIFWLLYKTIERRCLKHMMMFMGMGGLRLFPSKRRYLTQQSGNEVTLTEICCLFPASHDIYQKLRAGTLVWEPAIRLLVHLLRSLGRSGCY